MSTARFKVGDTISVFACGLLVDVREVQRATSRSVEDDHGQLWTQGGERWGFANGAFDLEFIRHAKPGEGVFCARNGQAPEVILARRRAALNRLPWAASATRPDLQPGALTIDAVFRLIQQDPAVAAWLEANL